MRYALVLLTHGEGPYLHHALDAFAEFVTPAPNTRLAVVDGPFSRMPPVEPLGDWHGSVNGSPRGFCESTREAFRFAVSACSDEFIFYLENDFVIQRPLDLGPLAALLDLREQADTAPPLAQVALKRQPCNPEETAVGGYVELHPGDYLDRVDSRGYAWLEHRRHFTTNPSLMRRDFVQAAAAPGGWPDGPECEGRFGIQLREAGWAFGLWGGRNDPPCVLHMGGQRTGHGY